MISFKPHLPKDRQFYLMIGGNIVVLALVGFFVLRPAFSLLVKHTTQITVTRAEISGLQAKTQNLKTLKETYPQYEAKYAPIIQALPKTKDTAGYLTQLEDLAKLTSVQLATTDTSTGPSGGQATSGSGAAQKTTSTQPTGGFPTIPVKLNVVGSYAGIVDFISRLETMDRFTKVTAMDLSTVDTSGAVKAVLDVQTLYLPGK